MSGRPLLIVGAGSFASEVGNLALESGWEPVAFCDTRLGAGETGPGLDGLPVLSLADAAALEPRPLALCALGTTHRGAEVSRLEALGFAFATLVHPSAQVPASVDLATGVLVGPGSIVGHATRLGPHTIVNRGVLIGHHTQVGALAILSPGANVAAQVSIGARCYIGMGSVVIDGRRVGEGCVVGAGAVVVRDLPDRVQAVGVPAKVVKEGIKGV